MEHENNDALSDGDELNLDKQLCFGLYAASHAMTKAYRPYLKELGLTYPQLLVMMALWERDALTVSALGEMLLLDSGTLSPLLKRLESAGLVQKTRQKQDERQVRVTLTPAGSSLRSGAAEMRRKIVCALGMSAEEVAQMRAELNAIMKTLSQDSGERFAMAAE